MRVETQKITHFAGLEIQSCKPLPSRYLPWHGLAGFNFLETALSPNAIQNPLNDASLTGAVQPFSLSQFSAGLCAVTAGLDPAVQTKNSVASLLLWMAGSRPRHDRSGCHAAARFRKT
jgi:hypothetical protein